MKDTIKQLLTSKKALATLAAVLVWVLGRFGLEIETAELLPLIGAISAFVVAQGWADKGKEAEKEVSKRELAMAKLGRFGSDVKAETLRQGK